MKQTPLKGSVKCNFKSVLTSKARGDVKDGGYVFKNDISRDISFNEDVNSICSIKLESGSQKSAEFEALKMLESVYQQYNMKKVMMSGEDAKRYQESTLKALESMPTNERKSGNSWVDAYAEGGLTGVLLNALSEVSNFYWHTTKEQLDRLSKVNLEKDFYIVPDEQEEVIWPTRLCITFDAHKGAYRRCIEQEEAQMKGVVEATEEALASDECQNLKEGEECGAKRKAEMLKLPEIKPEFRKDNNLI